MKRVLCIWLPNWPIQRLVVARPELKAAPIVLHARDPRRGQRVVACSKQAKQAGIRIGMSLAEASTLLRPSATSDSTPSLTLETHDLAADRKMLQQLAEWCEQFSPVVGLDDSEHPAGLLLDTTGIGHLFGGDQALAERVAIAMHRRGYWARVAMAATVGAAWGIAHFHRQSSAHAPSLTTKQTSNNTTRPSAAWPPPKVISATETLATLAPLPIEALRLSASNVELLHRLGVDRIQQLLTLPRDGLKARLGDEVTMRLDQATGDCNEIILAHHSSAPFQAEWTLEHPTDRRPVILQVVEHLSHHLASLLHAQDQGAVQLCCSFSVSSQVVTINVGLFRPTANGNHMFELLRMQLESCHLPGSVSQVVLQARHTARLPHDQRELWDQGNHDRPQALADLVDRLSSRLGSSAVMAARLRSSVLPEEGYALIPLTGPESSQARLTSAAGKRSPLQAGQRPLQLLHPPQPLQVVSVAPDGPPICFDHAGLKQQVDRHWGPERIETGWWQGSCIRRDYYRVECKSGSRFWLFRRLNDQAWFLHGRF